MTEIEFMLLGAWAITFGLYINTLIDYRHERRMASMMVTAMREIAAGRAEVCLTKDDNLQIKHKE